MASQWIPASKVIAVFSQYKPDFDLKMAICARAHEGVLMARAQSFSINQIVQNAGRIPSRFWWAEGHEALEQDWVSGDFATFESNDHMRCFGVSFDLEGLLQLVDFEKRSEILGLFSVARNADWVSAQSARRFVYEQGGKEPSSADRALLEQCGLGFVLARASLCQISNSLNDKQWSFEEREWNIEPWVWQTLTRSNSKPFDWQTGTFKGQVRHGQNTQLIHLSAVYFLKSSLQVFLPAQLQDIDLDDQDKSQLPPLSERQLNKWWSDKLSVRESLTQEELLAVVRTTFPQNSISRDRIRTLTGSRTTGPKPIRG